MSELNQALKTAFNCTFPAVLRTHSWLALERLHGYATYEQWYNAEIVMHLGREVNGCQFDGEWVCVRGEAPIGSGGRRVDWAIVKWDASRGFARVFKSDDVFAVGETRVIGLAAAGEGPKVEAAKIVNLAGQLSAEPLRSCIQFAHLVLPCWQKRRCTQSLDQAAQESLEGWVLPGVRDQFEVVADFSHVQVVTGWFGDGADHFDTHEREPQFALLQLLLCSEPGGRWQPVNPPIQHRLAMCLARNESESPVHASATRQRHGFEYGDHDHQLAADPMTVQVSSNE